MTLSGSAKLAGVMGDPVSHSLSPRLHGYWLDHYRIDGAYLPMHVAPMNLADALRALPKLGFRGVNLTVPHKETGLACMDHVSARATRIGAVNTVVVGDDGKLHGDNTDGFGFIENIKAGSPETEFKSATVTVLGAGGAARAVVAGFLDAGAREIRLVNRTLSRAETLAKDLRTDAGGEIIPLAWSETPDALEGAQIVVNTTSLGMTGQEPLKLEAGQLPSSALVTDIVYSPLRTPLLELAVANGNPIVDGLGMLLHQARPGFEAWFGTQPEVTDALRRHIEAGLGA